MKRSANMYRLSAVLPSPPLSFESALSQASLAGFEIIDVTGLVERPACHLDALADSGLIVSAGVLGHGLPEDHVLDSPFASLRRATLELLKSQVADIARLGATHAVLAPGNDGSAEGLMRFGEVCRLLAEYAGRRMVQFGIEHVPNSALPSAGSALEWLDQPDYEEIGLVLNVGHCLMTHEDPRGAIGRAGRRLRYVVLGSQALGDETLKSVLRALRNAGYDGLVALTVAGRTMEESKQLVQQILGDTQSEA